MPDPDESRISVPMSDEGEHYDNDKDMTLDDDTKMMDQNQAPAGAGQGEEVKKKYDPKDPFRPRRKKARRACYACQRAHLTCGKIEPGAHFLS